jgi:hypothetical protein
MSRSGPIPVGREDRHLAEFAHFFRERKQPGRLNSVVVGYEYVHGLILCVNW